jgi:hypothetical protein
MQYHNVRRDVVGECDVVTEKVEIHKKWVNVTVEKITRTFSKHLVLSCGHVLPRAQFKKVSNTRCEECSVALDDDAVDPSDMSQWQNWRVGDVLLCTSEGFGYSKGTLYRIQSTCDMRGFLSFVDKHGYPHYRCASVFSFHSRPDSEVDAPYAVIRAERQQLPLPYTEYVNFVAKDVIK